MQTLQAYVKMSIISVRTEYLRATGRVEILRVSMQLKNPGTAEAVGGLGRPIYNLKVIPSVKKGTPRLK